MGRTRRVYISYPEAAQLLGCSRSSVGRAVERGELDVRMDSAGRTLRPALLRQQVLDLRDEREGSRQLAAERRQAREARRALRSQPPPDETHEWVGTVKAAELLGVSRVAVQRRGVRGTLPVVVHRGKRWFRVDHMRLVGRAHRAQRTREVAPPAGGDGPAGSDLTRRSLQQRLLLEAVQDEIYGAVLGRH